MDWLHFGKRLMGQHAASYAEAEKTYWELLRKNLPGIPVKVPSLTDKDEEDLIFAIGQEVDTVAVSFVRTADDVRHDLDPLPEGRDRQDDDGEDPD